MPAEGEGERGFEIGEIVEAMRRELSPDLVEVLTDLPLTEVPAGLDGDPVFTVEPFDPRRPETPYGTALDCGVVGEGEPGVGGGGEGVGP